MMIKIRLNKIITLHCVCVLAIMLMTIGMKVVQGAETTEDKKENVIYWVYQNKEWSTEKMNGKTAGTSKNNNAVIAVKVNITGSLTGDIQYSILKNKKWSDWNLNGKSTRIKNSQMIEGIKIALKGELRKKYDIYYRVNSKTYGWTGWGKNGQSVGSINYGRQIFGLQVKLVEKGTEDAKAFLNDEVLFLDATKMVVKVNKQNNCVTIYQGKKPIKVFLCSSNRYTSTGTYYSGAKYRWRVLYYNCYGQYTTQIHDNILFHSVPYNSMYNNMSLQTDEYNKLGTFASHGCIRMPVNGTKYIYDNCLRGTKIVIYSSKNPGPLGKPKLKKIPKKHKWDPTDPTVKENK